MDDPKPVSPDKNEQGTSNELRDQPYNDTQTETYVSPSGEPTTITPLPTPLSLQKPKSHAGRWFIRGFVVLIIAALAAFGYWQWTEAQSANNERASLQSELETVKAANKSADSAGEEADLGGGKDFVPQTFIAGEVKNFVKANSVLSQDGDTYNEDIKYLSEKFARVDVLKVDPTDKTKTTLSATYFLKNAADATADKKSEEGQQWTLIWTDPVTDADKKYLKETFGVTDEVFSKVTEE